MKVFSDKNSLVFILHTVVKLFFNIVDKKFYEVKLILGMLSQSNLRNIIISTDSLKSSSSTVATVVEHDVEPSCFFNKCLLEDDVVIAFYYVGKRRK